MNEALFNLGIDEVDKTSSKEKYANKPPERNKETEIQKLFTE